MKVLKLLLDECAPKKLKTFLLTYGYKCSTAQEMGWAGIRNGELMALADPFFDVLVTIDKGIQYQQNMTGRRIAIVIVRRRSNRLEDLSPNFPVCAEILQSIQPGQVVEIGNH
jgi:predicted nuclease of predicted toxin-antitoxin system